MGTHTKVPSGILLQGGAVAPPPYSQVRGNSRRDRVRSGMREFESSHSSQAVRRLKISRPAMAEMPANGGLLRIGYWSPGSEIGRCGSEIADSLRRIFEIFPFSGDSDRRLGSIGTARRVT